MVIVDTTVWIDYVRGAENPESRWLDRELQRNWLGLTNLILCEVSQGIRHASRFTQVRSDLLKFQVFQTVGVDLAVAASQNDRDLRRQQGYRLPHCHFLFASPAWAALPGP